MFFADGGLVGASPTLPTPLAPEPVPMPPAYAMAPPAGGNSTSNAITIHEAPMSFPAAPGVTPDQVAAFVEQRSQHLLREIKRNIGPMLQEWNLRN